MSKTIKEIAERIITIKTVERTIFIVIILILMLIILVVANNSTLSLDNTTAAIIGIIVGFLLAELRYWFQEGITADRTYKLLKHELDSNLKSLQEIFDLLQKEEKDLLSITFKPGEERQDWELGNSLANYLSTLTLPPWRNNVWKNQNHILVRALENNLDNVHTFYTNLDEISFIYNKILEEISKFNNYINSGVYHNSKIKLDSIDYYALANDRSATGSVKTKIFYQCKATIIEILNSGNPLT